jgi:hypothetical protein
MTAVAHAAREGWLTNRRFAIVSLLLLAGCGSAVLVPERDLGSEVRARLVEGDYRAALRLLPAAMAECEREADRTGHSVAVLSGSLDAFVLQTIAVEGEADWGAILDDPGIPHRYKTGLLFEIIESRLGKGSVYAEGEDRYVVPVESPVDLDEHWEARRHRE